MLGKRLNKPARVFWFVPGGRVLKNERLADAFLRLPNAGLGVEIAIQDARYIGLYEHFYDDSALSDSVSPPYIVNAFVISLSEPVTAMPF